MSDAPQSAAPPDPAEAAVALLESLASLADAADEEAWQQARANFERAKTAWAEGWTKGAAGLLAVKPTAPG